MSERFVKFTVYNKKKPSKCSVIIKKVTTPRIPNKIMEEFEKAGLEIASIGRA